ncbi:MAG: putative lipid II flippase FtsW, partial [Gammaproteobacteria bacterium]
MSSVTSVQNSPRSHLLLRLDPVLTGVFVALLLLGAVMVTSASVSVGERQLGEPLFHAYRHGIAALIGVGAMIVVLVTDTRWLERTGFIALALALFLLAIVLIPGLGHTVNGATRWLKTGFINVQASEPARLLILIYLSGYIVRHGDALRTGFTGLLRPMLFVGAACVLLLAEPDFGAAVVLAATALAMLFVGGVRFRDCFVIVALSAAVLTAIAISSAYRVERLTTFLDPWADPFDSGFQLTQSLIAIGRGEWFGVGLGASVQKLFYLPEAHTDFVFAVLAEELGLVGVVVTILLFAALLWRAFRISEKAATQNMMFQAYLAFGIGLWLGLQAVINIAVNMGLLPTKGLTLPLLSYGRSSLIVT